MSSARYPELPPPRVLAALDGDREAFVELYRCYSATVRSSTAAALRFRADLTRHLDDIVGEIWARFLADGCKRLRGYDPDRGVFGYYLRMRTFAMARTLAAQYVRRSPTVELDDPLSSLLDEADLEQRVLDQDALERLHAAVLERLSEVDVTFFEQVYVQGRMIMEVAEPLGLGRDAAYRRSHRLKAKIQRIADELFGADSTNRPGPAIVGILVAFVAQSGQLGGDLVRSWSPDAIEEYDHATQ